MARPAELGSERAADIAGSDDSDVHAAQLVMPPRPP
jgi:hypothetical protein